MNPELRAELENLVFSAPSPYLSLDNRLQPFLDIVERAVAAERDGLLDLFSKRMGMSVSTLLEHLPELNATPDETA